MLYTFRNFRGWVVLEFFLKNPNTKIHLKGLAKKLKISPRTAEVYCKSYLKEGILALDRVANTTQYSLDNDKPLVKAVKKMYALSVFNGSKNFYEFAAKNKNIIEIFLYGSYADGEYSSNSDVDLLIITQGEKKLDVSQLARIGEALGSRIETTIYTIGEWRKKQNTSFAVNVNKNKILLYRRE